MKLICDFVRKEIWLFSWILMLIASGDVHAATAVGILDALELHAKVFVVVALHGDAVGLHPVHDEQGELHPPAADVGQFLPHVHGEDVVDGLGHGLLAMAREVVELLGAFRLAPHQAHGQFSGLLRFGRCVGGPLAREVPDDIVQIRTTGELAGTAEVVFAPLPFVPGQTDIDKVLAHGGIES